MEDMMTNIPTDRPLTAGVYQAGVDLAWPHEAIKEIYKLNGLLLNLSASPPAREEAPGEGAGEPMSEREVRQWIDACNHEPGRQVLRDYLALRARTSEPAREGRTHPTGEPIQDALIAGFLHGVGRSPWDDMHDYIAACARDYAKGEHLPHRTHPAPATADKLKVAKEALERVKNTTHKSTGYPDLSARQAAYAVAFEALATLNEEGDA